MITVVESACANLTVDRYGKDSEYEGIYHRISSTCNSRTAYKNTTATGDIYYLYYHVGDVLADDDIYGWTISEFLCHKRGN